MAKKSTKPTAKIEEYAGSSEDIVEYDPARAQATEEAALESSASDPGAMAIDQGLVQACESLEK